MSKLENMNIKKPGGNTMEYFENLSRMQRLMWSIGIMLVVDVILDQTRIIFNLYPENIALSTILAFTTAIFASLYTGIFLDEKEAEQ